jgi:hypothetical protein
MEELYAGHALAILQSRLDALQAQYLIAGKRTDITAEDRRRLRQDIYRCLTALAVDWEKQLARRPPHR